MDEALQAEICARIKQARGEAGMTLEEMADALGVTQRAYWNYEHNRVPFRRLNDIAEITATTQGWLLHGEITPALDVVTAHQIDHRLEALEGQVSALATRTEVIEGLETLRVAIDRLANRDSNEDHPAAEDTR